MRIVSEAKRWKANGIRFFIFHYWIALEDQAKGSIDSAELLRKRAELLLFAHCVHYGLGMLNEKLKENQQVASERTWLEKFLLLLYSFRRSLGIQFGW